MTNLEQRAARLFNNPLVPDSLNEYNRRAWIRSVKMLGNRWLIANPTPILKGNQDDHPRRSEKAG